MTMCLAVLGEQLLEPFYMLIFICALPISRCVVVLPIRLGWGRADTIAVM